MKKYIITYLKDGSDCSFNIEAVSFYAAVNRAMVKIAFDCNDHSGQYPGVDGMCIIEDCDEYDLVLEPFIKAR